MTKRILSFCLALAVLLVALPIMPVGELNANAAAPGEANPVFTTSQLPTTVVDRIVASFDEADAQVSFYTFEHQVPVGIFDDECIVDFKEIKDYIEG